MKVNGSETGNAPFVENGHFCVPLNEIAQKMGDSVTLTSSQQKVSVRKNDGKLIVVVGNQARTIWQGKIVPLKTRQINNVIMPVNAKANFNGTTPFAMNLIIDILFVN